MEENVGSSLPKSSPSPTHSDLITSHLYYTGFVKGLYSDCLLRVMGPAFGDEGVVYRLHRLIIAQSPVIQEALEQHGGNSSQGLNLTFSDPSLTPLGLSLSLAHLYSSFAPPLLTSSLSSSNSPSTLLRSVLAASYALGVRNLWELCLPHVTHVLNDDTVKEWCDWCSAGYSWDGVQESIEEWLTLGLLKECCSHGNKETGNVGWPHGSKMERFVRVIAQIPFEWCKKVIEGGRLNFPSDMER